MAASESGVSVQWSVADESENDPQPRTVPHPMSPPAKPSTRPQMSSSSVRDEPAHEPASQPASQPAPQPAVEQRYKERFETLRSVYEGRIASMSAQLRAAYRDIETDQVLAEMRADPASGAFVRARVAEMVEHTLDHEREAHIVRLSEHYAEARNAAEMGERAQRELEALSAHCAELESELRDLREAKEQARSSRERAIRAEAAVDVLQARQHTRENASAGLHDAEHAHSRIRELHSTSSMHSAATNNELGVLGPGAHVTAQRLNQLVATVASLQAVDLEQRKENAELRVQCEQARVDHDDVTELLRKSEAERLALRAKYIEVGERMEVVLEEEAHERHNTTATLQNKLQRCKTRLVEESEKHRVARAAARSAEEQVDKLKAEHSAIAKEFAQLKECASADRAAASRDADALEQQLAQHRAQTQARDTQARQQILARDEELAKLRVTHERTVLRLQQQARADADKLEAEREQCNRKEWEANREQRYRELEAGLREQFESTTGTKQMYGEVTGAGSGPVPPGMAPVLQAAVPFPNIDENIEHIRAQFEARVRELEEKKDAELRTAMKNMASGVRKLEEQLKIERAVNEELKQDVEEKQAQIVQTAESNTKVGVSSSEAGGDSTGANASNGALVEHLRESNASIVRLKHMLQEQTAKVRSAEHNIEALTRTAQEAQKQREARDNEHAERLQQAERDGVNARQAAAAAKDRLRRLSLECPMLRNNVSAMRRELTRTRDHAVEVLGRLHAEVASGMESVVQRANAQQAAAQQHVEEHWVDKLQASQRQHESAQIEWSAERASAAAKLAEAERSAGSASKHSKKLTEELERVRAEADQLPHVREELREKSKKLDDATRQLRTTQTAVREFTERFEQKRSNMRSVLLALSPELHLAHELQSGLLGETQEQFDACLRLLRQRVSEHTRAQRDEAKQEVMPQLQQLRDAHQELLKRRDRAEQQLEDSQRQVDEAKCESHACKLHNVKLQQELAELCERERVLNDEVEKARADMSMMGELQQMERDSQVKSLQAQLDEAQRRHEEARRDWEVSLEAQLDETKERVLEEQHRNKKTRADEAQQHKVELADEAQQHNAQRVRLTEQIMILQQDKRALEKRLNDATRELGVKKREAERHQRRHKEAVAQVDELHEQLQDQLSRSRQLASAASESCFEDGPASLSILGSSTPLMPRRGVRNLGVSREVGSAATPASAAKRAGLSQIQGRNQAFDAPGSTDAKNISGLALAS